MFLPGFISEDNHNGDKTEHRKFGGGGGGGGGGGQLNSTWQYEGGVLG